MKYVAIVKTVGDLAERPAEHKDSYAQFPLEVRQFESKELAEKAYPGHRVMPVEQYNGYKEAMNEVHGTIKKPRAWWKFWSKA